MSEAKIQAAIAKRLRALGCLVFKLTMLGYYGTRGWSDLLVLPGQGEVLFMEVKVPGEDLKPHQLRRKKKLEARGYVVHVVDSVAQAGALL